MIFYKTSSFGNDFIEIDVKELACPQGRRPRGGLAARAEKDKGELAQRICDRQRGVGADGVVFYRAGPQAARPGDKAPEKAALSGFHLLRGSSLKRVSISPGPVVDFQIFNRDGGEAELSGNGMAGLSAVLFQRRLAASPLTLHAGIGSRRVELLGRDGAVFQLAVEIGRPDFANREFFPFLKPEPGPCLIDGLEFHPVSVGNPHAVIICPEMPPGEQLAALGKKIEGHAMFPKRVNVEFVRLGGDQSCQVYFYERGVGPTLASSTGSAAVFAVLRRLGMAGECLDIDLGAEKIQLSWNNGIFLRNITRIICRGEYFL